MQCLKQSSRGYPQHKHPSIWPAKIVDCIRRYQTQRATTNTFESQQMNFEPEQIPWFLYRLANIRTSFFVRGRRQGRQPLNPAMPRRIMWEAKHSFSYPGARPCRRPSPKILQPAGVFTFLGVRGGKKRVKFEDAFWRFLLGVFWSFFLFFLVLSTRKNRIIYNVFVPLASKKSFYQHAGNCVNSSVLARLGPQNTVNTVIFARKSSKPRKYRGFALVRSQTHWYLRCFFVPRR